MNELQAILARLPHRRVTIRVFAERRDAEQRPAWRDLWGWLAAELATLDDEERADLLRRIHEIDARHAEEAKVAEEVAKVIDLETGREHDED